MKPTDPRSQVRISRLSVVKSRLRRIFYGEGRVHSFCRRRPVRVIAFLLGTLSPVAMYSQSHSNVEQSGDEQTSPGEVTWAGASLFAIDNPRNQAVPVSEAKTIYLSACRVVEQEFGRTDPIRPRLTLLLGSDSDRVYYPKHEIQLTKWDKYKFAQGVVMLAADALLPDDKRILLTRLAVVEAESTVDVRELKGIPPHDDNEITKSPTK